MLKIATIGFFDGVHRGHRFLFAQLLEQAAERQLQPVIYTFRQHPREVLTGVCPAMLTTQDERERLLKQYGEVRFLDFKQVQHLTAEQFMRYLLSEGVSTLLMGYDHRFGADNLCGFSDYERLARVVGLRVLRAHECMVDGMPVSSSRIRKLLEERCIEQVNQLLGYRYSLTGFVEHGNEIGRKIGFPTANIHLDFNKQLPATGVYSVITKVDGVEYRSIANIGTNPTVGNHYLSLEVHLVDFQGDLYGKKLEISLLSFLREEKKFASLSELKQQIVEDIDQLCRV